MAAILAAARAVDPRRSARLEVRNPVLALPAAREILALPPEHRTILGILLRELSKQSDDKATTAWGARKGIMAAYWRATSTFSKHLARALDPRTTHKTKIVPEESNR